MNRKEATKILNKYRNQNYNSLNEEERVLAQAIDVLIGKDREKALEPLWQITARGKSETLCGYCRRDIALDEKYCSHCGQKIDWSK